MYAKSLHVVLNHNKLRLIIYFNVISFTAHWSGKKVYKRYCLLPNIGCRDNQRVVELFYLAAVYIRDLIPCYIVSLPRPLVISPTKRWL